MGDSDPAQVVFSPGKTNNSFAVYLPPVPPAVTERILGFTDPSQLALCSGLTEVRFRLGHGFDYDFLKIPHWQLDRIMVIERYSLSGFPCP